MVNSEEFTDLVAKEFVFYTPLLQGLEFGVAAQPEVCGLHLGQTLLLAHPRESKAATPDHVHKEPHRRQASDTFLDDSQIFINLFVVLWDLFRIGLVMTKFIIIALLSF
jgi:hypothetical protein